MLAVAMTTVSFTSCEGTEETDAEILAKISNSTFSGKDGDDNVYTLTLGASDFTLIEPDGTTSSYIWKGVYQITNGRLILTITSLNDEPQAGKFDLEIDGTTILFPTYNASDETYTGPVVKLKKK